MRYPRIIILLSCLFCFSLYADTVRIGVPIFAPPFVVDIQHYTVEGFDVELMDTICGDLNWQCQFIPLRNNLLFEALNQNQVDFIVGGLIISPERRLLYLFSDPYLPSKGGFIVLPQSPIKVLADLKNKRVGTVKGSMFDDYLKNFPIPIKVISYDLAPDLTLAVKNGDVDAAFINYYTALHLNHQYSWLIRAINQPLELGEGIGIATIFKNVDKIEQINQLLKKYESDGTYVKLYNYYFQFFAK